MGPMTRAAAVNGNGSNADRGGSDWTIGLCANAQNGADTFAQRNGLTSRSAKSLSSHRGGGRHLTFNHLLAHNASIRLPFFGP